MNSMGLNPLILACICCWIVQFVECHSSSKQKCTFYDSTDKSHQNDDDHSRAKRLTGGMQGSIERMPWMVFLSTNSQVNGMLRVVNCTGSLISPRHVLTNAHCIAVAHMLDNNTISLTLGSADRTVAPTVVRNKYSAHIHPNFTTYVVAPNAYTRHDLAIVDLGKNFKFTDKLHSICTVCLDDAYPQGKAIIAGWGNQAVCNNGLPNLYAQIFKYDIVGIHTCLTPEYPINNKVCTDADSQHGIGGNDSGGPVLGKRNNRNSGRHLYQIGVNGGNNCVPNQRENAFDKIDGPWLEQLTGVKCKKFGDDDE